MNCEFIDFKTVKVDYSLDTTVGAELALRAESRVAAKAPEDWSGFVYVYLTTRIHDDGDQYFVFETVTETVFKVPDEITDITEELMAELVPVAQEKSYVALRDMSLAMGINELDLTK